MLRLALWYEERLAARPLLVKSITSGVLYGLGDALAQVLTGAHVDASRWMRALLYGSFFYPLPAHLHYEFLEWLVTVRCAVRPALVPLIKVLLEQFVYWSYLSNAYYLAVLGMLHGLGAASVARLVASTLLSVTIAQWAFWVPFQLLNFRCVPVRHQLLAVLVGSL